MGHTQPVFQFLCPLEKLLNEEEHYGGVWSLLSGLAYFLTPGQEEDEVKFLMPAVLQVSILKDKGGHFLSIYLSYCPKIPRKAQN